MRSKGHVLVGLAFLTVAPALTASQLQLTNLTPRPGSDFVVLDLETAGTIPAGPEMGQLQNVRNWTVFRTAETASVPDRPQIERIKLTQYALTIALVQSADTQGDGRAAAWTLLFTPPAGSALLPMLIASKPVAAAKAGSPGPVHRDSFFGTAATKSASDFYVNGSFLAGGNTKPIYALDTKFNLFATSDRMKVFSFLPGLTAAARINQSVQPPNGRTRIDPDSMSAAASFWRLDPIQKGFLYGISTQLDAVRGEFSRASASSNLMAGLVSTFVLRPVVRSSTAFTFYPVAGLEGGWNLNQPSTFAGTPVNLNNYTRILRGVAGADTSFNIFRADDLTDSVFSIGGSYRYRALAAAEPLVTFHGPDATVALTTKPRHWVETHVTYYPWPYFGLDVSYQYGSLPPVFSFVNHQVTIGLLLQATQKNKPNASLLAAP